jgi:hypothetical protein
VACAHDLDVIAGAVVLIPTRLGWPLHPPTRESMRLEHLALRWSAVNDAPATLQRHCELIAAADVVTQPQSTASVHLRAVPGRSRL